VFTQTVNPAGNLLVTWILAAIPVVALLFLLAVVWLSTWVATLIGSLITFLLGLYVWRMPLGAIISLKKEAKICLCSIGLANCGTNRVMRGQVGFYAKLQDSCPADEGHDGKRTAGGF
jgi:hypothetical protein